MKRSSTLLALLLSACLPSLEIEQEPPVIPGTQAQTATLGEYETYYETIGEGPAIVMVHGIGGGSSGFQYRKNASAFAAAGYSVYVVDLLGFGRSAHPERRYTQDLYVEQLAAFLEEVSGKATVVANGLSAAYAIRIAAEQPELVESLVLISPTGYERLARPQDEARIAAFENFTGFAGNLLYVTLLDEGTQRLFLLDAYIGRESLTPEVLDTYDRNLKVEKAKWAVLSFISGNLDQDVSELWPEVTQPTLITWGTEGDTTPIGDAADFLRVRPETEFIPFAGAKLLPNEDRAETFNEVVLAFLARNK